mmetsp:Transcript_28886/g.69835  ORF Transcript_28886/g.69835 Transcript_28886/m.69835 type:complete len:532 (-) Transcript_28886:33-1628(-)
MKSVQFYDSNNNVSSNVFGCVASFVVVVVLMLLSSLPQEPFDSGVVISSLNDHRGGAEQNSLLLLPIWRPKQQHNPKSQDLQQQQEQQQKPKPPVLVFILVGQSNMQGHGYVNATTSEEEKKEAHATTSRNGSNKRYKNGTLEWMVETYPEKYGKLKTTNNKTRRKRTRKSKTQLNGGDVYAVRASTEGDDEVVEATTTRSLRQNPNQNQNQNRKSRIRPNPETNTDTNTDEWTVRNDVWIAYNHQWIDDVRPAMNMHGNLYPGYGGDPHDQLLEIGPEYGFGWTIADGLKRTPKQQILLIKVGWGGKSLAVDFRPPSSSNETMTTGLFYTAMMSDIYLTLAKIDDMFPPPPSTSTHKENGHDKDDFVVNDGDHQDEHDEEDQNSKIDYKLSGFFWHQGWNDGCFEDMTNEYETNLANFIRDIRIDLETPNLPVVVANSGMVGYDGTNKDDDESKRRRRIIDAQMAVSQKYPEFVGNVQSVETRPFFRPVDNSPGDQIYHWNNNYESYWLVGEASADAMLGLIDIQQQTLI